MNEQEAAYAHLVELYVAGELTSGEREQLQRILAADAALSGRFPGDVRLAIRLAGVLYPQDAGGSLAERVLALQAGNRASAQLRLVDRVESRLRAGRRRRQRPSRPAAWWVWATAACLLISVGVWVAARPASRPAPAGLATLAEVSSGVDIVRAGHEADCQGGMALLPEDRISTGRGTAALLYADGTRIALAPATTLRLAEDDGAKRIHLDGGSLKAVVAKQPAGRPLRLLTVDGQATVVGTVFTLAITDVGTLLSVDDGQVEMARAGQAVLVHAGERTLAAQGRPLRVDSASPARPGAFGPCTVEDGRRPPELVGGAVAEGPPRSGSRYAIAGGRTTINGEPVAQIVFQRKDRPLAVYTPGMRLRFTCWFSSPVPHLYIGLWHRDLGKSLVVRPRPAQSSWQEVEVRLDELHPDGDAAVGLRPGDGVWDLTIGCDAERGGSLFIDDMELTAPP